MQDLALEAQRAGYSVLIYFANSVKNRKTPIEEPSKEILLIPVFEGSFYQVFKYSNNYHCNGGTNVEISVQVDAAIDRPPSKELDAMQPYLENLYYWFLVGPIITLEWMRRTKKFCWHSGRHERNENPLEPEAEDQVETDAEREIRTMKEG